MRSWQAKADHQGHIRIQIYKTAYATIKGIEVMHALRKGQASLFYYGQPRGEVCLINRVFGL
jgi:transposase-like protein